MQSSAVFYRVGLKRQPDITIEFSYLEQETVSVQFWNKVGLERGLDWGFLSKILFDEAGVGEQIQGEVCYSLPGLGADILL